jgi:hypothetical protein
MIYEINNFDVLTDCTMMVMDTAKFAIRMKRITPFSDSLSSAKEKQEYKDQFLSSLVTYIIKIN